MCTLTKKTKQLASVIFQVYSHTLPCWQLCSIAQVPKKQLQEPQVEATGVLVCSEGLSEQWHYAYLRTQSSSPCSQKCSEEVLSKNEDASITQAIATTLPNKTQSLSL